MATADIDVRSCTDVLNFCLSKHDKCSDELLAKEVAGVAKILAVGLDFYRPIKTSLDEKYFKEKRLTEDVVKLLRRLCADLKLDASVGHTLFLQYVSHDACFSDKTFTNLLRSSHASADFLKRLRAFFCLERLSLLSLLTLALAEGDDQPLGDLLLAATGKTDRRELTEMVIAMYEKHCEDTQTDTSPARAEEEHADGCRAQQLEEQLQLLKALLVAATSGSLTSAHCDRLQRLFRSHTLARRPSQLVQPSVKDADLVEQVVTFQFLICVHACDIQSFFSMSAINKLYSHPMASSARMEALDKLVVGLDQRPYMAGFLLLNSLCHMAFSQGEKSGYGRRAVRDFHVFQRLSERLQLLDGALRSDSLESSLLQEAVYAHVYDFLALLLACVHVDSLCEERDSFLALLCQVLPRVVPVRGSNSRSLTPLVPLLEDLAAEFPHSLAFVNVCAALATEQSTIAELVTQLLQRMRAFTETTEAACSDVRQVRPCPNRPEEFVAVEPRAPYGHQGSLVIPKGARGLLRGHLISWKFSYSFWDVAYSEVRANQLRAREVRVWARLRQIFDFARKWLAVDRFLGPALPLTCSALQLARAIDRSTFSSAMDLELAGSRLATALRLAALQIRGGEVGGVVELLLTSGLVPIVRQVEEESNKVNSIALESSLFEDLHNAYERRFGLYPVTEAYLELCLALVPSSENDACLGSAVWADRGPLLIAAAWFMAHGLLARLQEERKAFLGCSSGASQVMTIVRHCLVFFTEFLTRRARRSGEARARNSLLSIQDLCVSCLLTPAVSECLLALTSVKVEVLESRRHMTSCAAVEPALSQLVWLALTLVGQLLDRPAGRAALLRRMEFSPPPAPHYFRSLLSFLLWEPPCSAQGGRIAVVALAVLRRAVQLSALPVLPCLGEAAPQLRAVFLRRLAAWGEEDALRAVQLDLLSEAVVSGRPGLLHLMAGQSGGPQPQEKEAAPPTPAEDCVAAVHAMLGRWQDCGPGLQLALFKFFDSVWQAEATAVTRRLAEAGKEGGGFWKRLEEAVEQELAQEKEQLAELPARMQIVGHIFSLVAMELYQKKWSNCESKFQDLIRHFLNKKIFVKWIKLLQWAISPEAGFPEDLMTERMSAAEMCFGRGRLLFLVLLRTAPPALETPAENELEFLTTLMTFFETLNNSDSDDCRPELAAEALSLMTVFIHRRGSRLKPETVERLLERIVLQLGVTRAKNDVPFSVHMDLLSCTTQLVLSTKNGFAEKNSLLWDRLFAITCEYVNLLTLKEELRPAEEKILSHGLVLLTNLVTSRPRSDWAAHVGLILNNVMHLLRACLSSCVRPGLVLHALVFLHAIAAHPAEAQLIAAFDLPCLLNFGPAPAQPSPRPTEQEELPSWSEAIILVLRLVSGLLSSLGRSFFPKAAAFFGAQWWAVLAPPVARSLRSLSPADLAVSEAVLQLLWGLAEHSALWRLHMTPALLEAALRALHFTVYRCTALLQAPKWLQLQLEAGGGGAKEAKGEAKTEGKENKEGKRRPRQRSRSRASSCGPESEEAPQPRVRRVESWLFRLLSISIGAFVRLSPRLSELVAQPSSELAEQELLLQPCFSSPNLQEEAGGLSMGVLISTLHLTVRQLSRIDARSSPTKALTSMADDVTLTRSMTTQCQEEALSLLMSQAVIVLNCPTVAPLDRQNVYRELSAELSGFLKNTGRHLRRSGVKSPDPAEPRVESMHRCVENFLKTVLK